jgi:hypothetical protein
MTTTTHTATVLVVDANPVERDETVEALRAHLGASCRVLGAGSLREADDLLAHAGLSGWLIALVIGAHRLPDGTKWNWTTAARCEAGPC